MFFKIVPTNDPVIPPEMSSFAYCKYDACTSLILYLISCRLEFAEDRGFEVRYLENKRYIDELRKVIPNITSNYDISTIIRSKIPVLTSSPSQSIKFFRSFPTFS